MPTITYACSIAHVASLLGEDLEMLETIASNDDNLTYGNIVSVHTGPDEYITALTDDGIEELREMLTAARGLNQTGFTGEHKAWKVSHDQRKFREPFFDRSARAGSAFGA